MASSAPPLSLRNALRRRDLLMPVVLVGILALMILPLPTFALDALLAVNIALSMILLLTAIQVRRTLDFSVFPSLLLVVTLFRLALNVSTTRLILLNGGEGTGAAGDIIETFGQFVVGGNIVIGVVVFLILTIINFVVITKGSGRIAEVSARFALDALPGKQMGIDAEVSAGLITQDQARKRRTDLARETEFYGAMDGGSKFVRGDAIAGLIITGINILGGLIIGVAQLDMAFGEAAQTFTVLTIGDGLVSQIPSLLVSTSAGIVVSRAADDRDLGAQVVAQVFRNPRVLASAALILGGVALVPGMPLIPFLFIVGGLLWMARQGGAVAGSDPSAPGAAGARPGRRPDGGPGDGGSGAAGPGPGQSDEIAAILPVESLELEVGYQLVPLVDTREDGEIAKRVTGLRRQFARELGIILPPVHLKDNLELGPGEYRLLVHGVEVARGSVMPDRLMAMDPGDIRTRVEGIDTIEPAFGLPAVWIRRGDKAKAELSGYTVVDPAVVIVTHVSEILHREAGRLIDRDGLQQLLDVVASRSPRVVEELLPNVMTYAEVLSVLRALLAERVSIRNLKVVLEALSEAARHGKALPYLVDQVRLRLGPAIAQGLMGPDGKLHVSMLDVATEDALRAVVVRNETDVRIAPDMALAQRLLTQLKRASDLLNARGHSGVVLAPEDLRYPLWRFTHRFLPQMAVVGQGELPPHIEVIAVYTVTLQAPSTRART